MKIGPTPRMRKPSQGMASALTTFFGKDREESTEATGTALTEQGAKGTKINKRELLQQEEIQEGGGTKWHEGKQPLHHQ